MARAPIAGPYGSEPVPFTKDIPEYSSVLSSAMNWYAYEKEKKDARSYLRQYISDTLGKETAKHFDKVPDSSIKNTFGWVARLVINGCVLSDKHQQDLKSYVTQILSFETPVQVIQEENVKPARPSVRENMEEKVKEYLGELEYAIDLFVVKDEELNLYNDLKARSIPQPYCAFIEQWIKDTAGEYVLVYESTDKDVKEGYSNISRRKLTQLIKLFGAWSEDLEKYTQFKKANRKPKARKVKSPSQQVAKLKYLKEDTATGVKSISPTEIIGASQVWIYNAKYRKLAVYRSESASGIQVKGTSLQNYDPEMCEQKTLRKPEETLKKVLEAGKIQLRKLLSDLTTKESTVNGRLNEECIILRAVK